MRVDSRARPSDVGRESTTFKAEQRIGYIIQNVGTNQQGSLDPRTRFNGRCFIVEPVGCLHLNDGFTGGRGGGITPMPGIIDAFSSFFALFQHWETVGKLGFHFTLKHTGKTFHSLATTIFQSLGERHPLLSSLPETNANTFPRNPYHRSTAN